MEMEQQDRWEKITSNIGFVFAVIFFLLNPFPHLTTIRDISWYLALFCFLGTLWQNRKWRDLHNSLVLPGAFFVLWALIGLFTALDMAASIHDLRTHLLRYILFFYVLIAFAGTEKKCYWLAWSVIISVLSSSLHEIYLYYIYHGHSFLDRIALVNQQLPVGPLGMIALYAFMLALTMLFFVDLTGKKKILLICCAVPLFFTVLFSQTRGVLLAMPFAMLVLFWGRRKLQVIFISIMLVLFLVTVHDLRGNDSLAANKDRLTINYISMLVFKERPVLGMGFSIDTFGDPRYIDHEKYRRMVPKSILHNTVQISSSHNMWMGLLLRTGIVGFLLFSIVYITALLISFKSLGVVSSRSMLGNVGRFGGASLLALGIYGLTNVVFQHLLETLLCLSFAMIIIGNKNVKKEAG